MSTPIPGPAVPTPAQVAPAAFAQPTPTQNSTLTPPTTAEGVRSIADGIGTGWLLAGLAVATASAVAAGYHGFMRNDKSKASAALWGFGGFIFPPILIQAAFDGYAEPSDRVLIKRLVGDIGGRPDLLAAMNEAPRRPYAEPSWDTYTYW